MSLVSDVAFSLNNSSGIHRDRLEFEGFEDCPSLKIAARAPQTFAGRAIGRISPNWATTRLQSGKVVHVNIQSACKRLNLGRREVLELCDRNELEGYVSDHRSTLRKVDSLLPHLAERTMNSAYDTSRKLSSQVISYYAPQWISSYNARTDFGLVMPPDASMFWHNGKSYFINKDPFDKGAFKEVYRTQPINSEYHEELVSLRGKADNLDKLIAVQSEHKFLERLKGYDLFPRLFHYSFDHDEFLFIEKSYGLGNLANNMQFLTLEEKRAVVLDLLRAICILHKEEICHNDLKPANVLLERVGDQIKAIVIDFGLSYERNNPCSWEVERLGTRLYAAPEKFYADRTPDHRVDIWALGLMIFELFEDQLDKGFEITTRAETFGWRNLKRPPRGYDETATSKNPFEQLIIDMLQNNPDNRPTAETALERFAALS